MRGAVLRCVSENENNRRLLLTTSSINACLVCPSSCGNYQFRPDWMFSVCLFVLFPVHARKAFLEQRANMFLWSSDILFRNLMRTSLGLCCPQNCGTRAKFRLLLPPALVLRCSTTLPRIYLSASPRRRSSSRWSHFRSGPWPASSATPVRPRSSIATCWWCSGWPSPSRRTTPPLSDPWTGPALKWTRHKAISTLLKKNPPVQTSQSITQANWPRVTTLAFPLPRRHPPSGPAESSPSLPPC